MKKFVYLLLVMFAIGVTGTLLSVSAAGGFSLDTYSVSDKEVISAQDIQRISVDLSSTDITVIPTEDKEITVELEGKISKKLKKKIELVVKESGKTLKVGLRNENQIKFNIGVLIVDTKVNIFLPEKLYESIDLTTSSGDITIQDLEGKGLSLKASSGDIVAENSKAKETFKIKTSSGEITSKNNEADRFEMSASSGDLLVVDQKAIETVLETSSGEMKLENIIGGLSAQASSGDIFVVNEEVAGNIHADTSSGDIKIEFVNKPTSLALEFRGSSGEGNIGLEGLHYDEKNEHEISGKIGSGKYQLIANTNSGDFYLD
ncbi:MULTISPECIES: DUF4097 family beta strand repeat-containing protein [unclassified Bacillus (in: firmicutes)]|uniref:DUF4097 family beta strand repeat-containing protein n=1 Tax=unclassified Bacillus (in: firmicutes) TaxID=185979 RepID=UPI0008EC8A45|nr:MULTISPECIES: DUF4097 family beta strand repeat-containing protein [unclassified Bacillus (in: firmicutes)]SFB24098.1 lia operon protein LiaG [Bacillus sp. UNCCL13]SFQ91327.1 lia operon protein LiaG [Bacillus sp. cl95]